MRTTALRPGSFQEAGYRGVEIRQGTALKLEHLEAAGRISLRTHSLWRIFFLWRKLSIYAHACVIPDRGTVWSGIRFYNYVMYRSARACATRRTAPRYTRATSFKLSAEVYPPSAFQHKHLVGIRRGRRGSLSTRTRARDRLALAIARTHTRARTRTHTHTSCMLVSFTHTHTHTHTQTHTSYASFSATRAPRRAAPSRSSSRSVSGARRLPI